MSEIASIAISILSVMIFIAGLIIIRIAFVKSCNKIIHNSNTMAQESVISFDFGEAIRLLKAGKKVARRGWNCKGMYLRLIRKSYACGYDVNNFETPPFIALKTAQDKIVPWNASHEDALAEDWMKVDS